MMMHPVKDVDGRQLVRRCPRCRKLAALWLRELTVDEAAVYREQYPLVLVYPGSNGVTGAEVPVGEMGALVPWLCCLGCGYDDHVVFGPQDLAGGMR